MICAANPLIGLQYAVPRGPAALLPVFALVGAALAFEAPQLLPEGRVRVLFVRSAASVLAVIDTFAVAKLRPATVSLSTRSNTYVPRHCLPAHHGRTGAE